MVLIGLKVKILERRTIKGLRENIKVAMTNSLKNINYLELEDYIVLEKMNLAKNFSKYLKKTLVRI